MINISADLAPIFKTAVRLFALTGSRRGRSAQAAAAEPSRQPL